MSHTSSALTALFLGSCSTATQQTAYIAPSERTITGETVASYDGTRQLVYVSNNSTVAVVITSFVLRDCENLKNPCEVSRLRRPLPPRQRVLVATIAPLNPMLAYNYRYSWTWDASGAAPSGSRAPAPRTACRADSTAAPRDTFAVDASYGTLTFRGSIDRVDCGAEYEYRTHLDATFHPDRRFNRTPVVDLIAWRFVATVPPNDSGPWKALHEESQPISVHLTEDGQTAHLPDQAFRLPKTVAAQARRVALAVHDGHFMWPIPVDLK